MGVLVVAKKRNLSRFLYGCIRYMPSDFMANVRYRFYTLINLKVGMNAFISVGAKLDIWDSSVPHSVGNCFFLGENSIISGGVMIGDNVSINSNVNITASPPSLISIGNDCLIGQNVVIRSDDHVFEDVDRLIRQQGHIGANINIEDDVWIGANTVVLKGVCIAAHSIVAAGSIVTKSFPPYSIIAGNPARLIKMRKN